MQTPAPSETNSRMHGYLPLSQQDGIEQFRVDGTIAVRSMLRELISARVHVVLFDQDDDSHQLIAQVERIEPLDFCLRPTDGLQHLNAFLASGHLVLVGITGAVKIQIPVESLSRRDDERGVLLLAPLPEHGWRVQRRDAYRVSPPADDGAQVVIREEGDEVTETPADLHDISAGGLCYYWPDRLPAPQVGQVMRHCRIVSAQMPALPCSIRIVRVSESELPGHHLVSCRFMGMPESVGRRIQVYVMDVERRMRMARAQD